MNDDVMKALGYLFVLAMLFLLVVYWAGSTGLLKTLFSGVNTLDLTATGRNAQGVVAAYPVQPK